jgi:hypothetical protein
MHPGATVHAYDIDPDAARKTIEMAALNNVSNRLEIHGGASWRDLLTVSNQKALIVCDCEGHERLLFSHQNISYLANSDLIIELHPFVCEDVTTYLLSLFSPSHACKLVTAIPDQDKNLELEQIQHLPLADKKLCVAEFRRNFQQWLICRHHSGSL